MHPRLDIAVGDLVGSRTVVASTPETVSLRCSCGGVSTVQRLSVVAYHSRVVVPGRCRRCGYEASKRPRPSYKRETRRS